MRLCVRCLLAVDETQPHDSQLRRSTVGALYTAYVHLECTAPAATRVTSAADHGDTEVRQAAP
ncbi:hypothetical protein [Streptomyces sp. NPDC005955]|uniref:hypothetical protein n=1 Tax=Streptomyces sp. NPDC005955 TaxID=3364738 RepID=UPI0036A0C8AB